MTVLTKIAPTAGGGWPQVTGAGTASRPDRLAPAPKPSAGSPK
jgi:hypothetical protein